MSDQNDQTMIPLCSRQPFKKKKHVATLSVVDGHALLTRGTGSGFKNVTRRKGRFHARVFKKGSSNFLGSFPTAVEAAIAVAKHNNAQHFEGNASSSNVEEAEGKDPNIFDVLKLCHLEEYGPAFVASGFDNVNFLMSLKQKSNNLDAMQAHIEMKPGHRMLFEMTLDDLMNEHS